jgi:hypothetical protein
MLKLLEMGYSDYRRNLAAVAQQIASLKPGGQVTDDMMFAIIIEISK